MDVCSPASLAKLSSLPEAEGQGEDGMNSKLVASIVVALLSMSFGCIGVGRSREDVAQSMARVLVLELLPKQIDDLVPSKHGREEESLKGNCRKMI